MKKIRKAKPVEQPERKIEKLLMILTLEPSSDVSVLVLKNDFEREFFPMVSGNTYPCPQHAKEHLAQHGAIVSCVAACRCCEGNQPVIFTGPKTNNTLAAFGLYYQRGKKWNSFLHKLAQFAWERRLLPTRFNLPDGQDLLVFYGLDLLAFSKIVRLKELNENSPEAEIDDKILDEVCEFAYVLPLKAQQQHHEHDAANNLTTNLTIQ